MKPFSKKATQGSKELPQESSTVQKKEFKRDESDNKLFPEIQVKDITSIITEDCVGAYDADTLLFQACSNVQTKFIRIKHLKEGFTEEMPNVTTFRGMGKGIKKGSWLHMKNVERELEGLAPYEIGDFEVENCQKLKYETEEEAIEKAKIEIYKKMKEVRLQFRIPRLLLLIGEGTNFRNSLPLCRPYKGNRKPSDKPLILKSIRTWAVKELGAVEATARWDGEMVECDDLCEYFANLGYKNYLATKRFNFLAISADKDSNNNPKLLVSPDKHTGKDNPLRGQWKQPQAMLVLDSAKDVGDVTFKTKTGGVDYKFYGFKGLLWQAFLSGDGADNYNCLTHLKQGLNFGDESAYRVLKPCTSAKESLIAVIDTFAELLPDGVKYTTHDGKDLHVSTLEYMDTYFKVAYMMRSENDRLDFYKLCEAFKVDVSKIKDNHIEKVLPLADEPTLRSVITELRTQLAEITDAAVPVKSETKPLQIERLNKTVDMLKEYDNMFDKLFIEAA